MSYNLDNKIQIKDLITTQHWLRNVDQLSELIQFVKEGKFLTSQTLLTFNQGRSSRLIQLTQFEDERVFITDGHHRILAIAMAGRDFLDESEYRLKKMTFHQYKFAPFDNEWCGGFDPMIEVRDINYIEIKRTALELATQDPIAAQQYVDENIKNFVIPRRHQDIYSIFKEMHINE